MRDKLIRLIPTSKLVSYGSLVLLIFIVAMKHPLHDRPQNQAKQYSYLALGDSYTIGEQVSAKENFPNQVATLLNDEGFGFSEPQIVAKTGWTTDELQSAIRDASLKTEYDFVSLLVGVNNQYRGRDVDQYAGEFESLLRQAVKLASNDSSRVFILSIPDWGITPFAQGRDRRQIALEIDRYNAANKLIAGKYKVHYIDITESTREAAADSTLLTSDGLHPSGKEYAKWARILASLIQKKL